MEKLFSISKTAKITNLTAETLRHYDRIGLVKPCKIDEWTGYRYYSGAEIVRLNTIRALKFMDLSLSQIKNILEFDDFNKIVDYLKEAEQNANRKIEELNSIKVKIERARRFYESKLTNESNSNEKPFVIKQKSRVIMLADKLSSPTVENLWNYHRHFYEQVGEKNKDKFEFEDVAGIYESNDKANMFAICTKYVDIDGLIELPKGNYLCLNSSEDELQTAEKKLIDLARTEYKIEPKFIVKIIVLTGILQWNYQIQIYLGDDNKI